MPWTSTPRRGQGEGQAPRARRRARGPARRRPAPATAVDGGGHVGHVAVPVVVHVGEALAVGRRVEAVHARLRTIFVVDVPDGGGGPAALGAPRRRPRRRPAAPARATPPPVRAPDRPAVGWAARPGAVAGAAGPPPAAAAGARRRSARRRGGAGGRRCRRCRRAGGRRTGPLPLHPMTVGDILDGAFKLLKANARTLFTIVAVFVVPLAAAGRLRPAQRPRRRRPLRRPQRPVGGRGRRRAAGRPTSSSAAAPPLLNILVLPFLAGAISQVVGGVVPRRGAGAGPGPAPHAAPGVGAVRLVGRRARPRGGRGVVLPSSRRARRARRRAACVAVFVGPRRRDRPRRHPGRPWR